MSLPGATFFVPNGTSVRIINLLDVISILAVTSTDSVYVTNGGFQGVTSLAADALGNLYVTDNSVSLYETVYKISPLGVVTHLAGVAGPVPNVESGIGGLAVNAGLHAPAAITLDAAGNIYFDDFSHVLAINMQSTTQLLLGISIDAGCIQNVAGQAGQFGTTGDGGPATLAKLNGIGFGGLAFAANGDLYISDSSSNRVRKVDHATGTISAVAGTGTFGYTGDGGPALNAKLGNLGGLAFDAAGNLYIADLNHFVIRAVNLTATTQTIFGAAILSGNIGTVAGNGTRGTTGDGSASTSAELGQPEAIKFDDVGNLYIGTGGTGTTNVRMIAPSGIISTVAGNGTVGSTGVGGLATAAEILFPAGLAFSGLPPVPAGVISEAQIDSYPAGVNNQFVRFRLRGFAGQVPRTTGGFLATVTAMLGSGSLSQSLIPNTSISPAGTTYTCEIWSNGRITSSGNITLTASGDLSTLL